MSILSNVFIDCQSTALTQNIYASINKVKDILQLDEKYQFNINLQDTEALSSWIARFNVHTSGLHCFSITLNNAWFLSHKDDDTEIIKAILHETVHGLDYQVISKSIRDYDTNYQNARLLLSAKSSNKFWLVAHYFFTLRSEGLALCAEQFLMHPSAFSMHPELTEASFNEGIHFLLNTSFHDEGPEFLTRFFESIYAFAGPLMARVYHFSEADFDLKQLNLITKKDLSEWVKDVLDAAHEAGIPGFLAQFSKALDVDFCSNKSIVDQQATAVKDVFAGIEPLDTLDLKEFDKLHPCNLKDIIYEDLQELYVLYGKDEKLLHAFHGYLKTKKDTLSDELPFLGLLDDFLVLQNVGHMLSQKQKNELTL